jgi:hypothetical protein
MNNPTFAGLKFPDMSNPVTLARKFAKKISGQALDLIEVLLIRLSSSFFLENASDGPSNTNFFRRMFKSSVRMPLSNPDISSFFDSIREAESLLRPTVAVEEPKLVTQRSHGEDLHKEFVVSSISCS